MSTHPLALPGPSTGSTETPKVSPNIGDVLETAPKTIDSLANKNDRWWFFALLLIGIGWTGWNQYKQDEQLAQRDAKIEKLEERMTSTLIGALNENTKAFQANTELLRRVEIQLLGNR